MDVPGNGGRTIRGQGRNKAVKRGEKQA